MNITFSAYLSNDGHIFFIEAADGDKGSKARLKRSCWGQLERMKKKHDIKIPALRGYSSRRLENWRSHQVSCDKTKCRLPAIGECSHVPLGHRVYIAKKVDITLIHNSYFWYMGDIPTNIAPPMPFRGNQIQAHVSDGWGNLIIIAPPRPCQCQP